MIFLLICILTDNHRTLSIHKKNSEDSNLCLHEASIDALKEVPMSNQANMDSEGQFWHNFNYTDQSTPSVPPLSGMTMYQQKNLPVHSFRQEILNQIDNNQVVLIAGETGKLPAVAQRTA